MKLPLASIGMVCLAAIAPFKAEAASFSQLYVFGDSLVDAGNFYQLTALPGSPTPIGIPQSPPYAQRFSNGPTWIEYFAAAIPNGGALGLAPALSTNLLLNPATDLSDGVYFGFGGAGTGLDNLNVPLLQNTGTLAQVGTYANLLNLPGFQPADDALFIYQAGANDLAGSAATAAVDEEAEIAILIDQNVKTSLLTLIGSGAKNVLVSNLPDLGKTPRFLGEAEPPAGSGLLTPSQRVASYNTKLSALVKNLSASAPEVKFIEFDFNGLFTQAINNPTDFGFTNVTSPCLTDYTFPIDTDGFSVCSNPEQYLFWDDFHPTTQANQFIASAALEQAHQPVPIPEPGLLGGLVSLAAIASGAALSRRQSSCPGSSHPGSVACTQASQESEKRKLPLTVAIASSPTTDNKEF